MKHYISNDTAECIRKLYHSDPDRSQIQGGITYWSIKKYGVVFDGGVTNFIGNHWQLSPSYYLEGPSDKITWFLLHI